MNEIDFESINQIGEDGMDVNEQDYLKLCMYECLRVEPPVSHSSSLTVTEDCVLGGVKVKKGEQMLLNIH